jgi:hypothetical protein
MFWIIFICIGLICFIAYQLGKNTAQTNQESDSKSNHHNDGYPDHRTGSGATAAGAFMAGYIASEIMNDSTPNNPDSMQYHPHYHSSEKDEVYSHSTYADDDEFSEDWADSGDPHEEEDIYGGLDDDDEIEELDEGDYGGGEDFGGGEF